MAYQLQSLQLHKDAMLDSFDFLGCVKVLFLHFCPSTAQNARKDAMVVFPFSYITRF